MDSFWIKESPIIAKHLGLVFGNFLNLQFKYLVLTLAKQAISCSATANEQF